MSNCLFEAAFENILERCRCAPGSSESQIDRKSVLLLITAWCIASNQQCFVLFRWTTGVDWSTADFIYKITEAEVKGFLLRWAFS